MENINNNNPLNNNANTANTKKEYYTIDVLQIFKALWHRVWIIILSALLVGVMTFSYASFAITPTYSSSVMLYVNNSSISLGNTNVSISASQITAAQSLLKTYREILMNRTTLERVIDKSGVPYTYGELAGMIASESANETEVMRVTVVSTDPYEAALIANCIAEVLPVRIAEIIDGASMEVVDSAVPNVHKIAPSITMYTFVGLVIGAAIAAAVIVVFALLDDTIHNEEYILENYDVPMLAKVPDLLSSGRGRYGRYGRYSRYGYYYQHYYGYGAKHSSDSRAKTGNEQHKKGGER